MSEKVMMKVTAILVVAVIVLTALATYLYFDQKGDYNPPFIDPKYDSLKSEVVRLNYERTALQDSIYAAQVDKGYKEIELNRSKSEYQDLYGKYLEAKKVKNPETIILYADSAFAEINDNYIPVSEYIISRANVIDSMHNVQKAITDSIDSKHAKAIAGLTDELKVERTENAKLSEKNKRGRKVTIFASVIGFVAGIITVLSIN